MYMCEQLNLEDSTDEILQQLGIRKSSRISFEDFIRCRSQVCMAISMPQVLDVDHRYVWLSLCHRY